MKRFAVFFAKLLFAIDLPAGRYELATGKPRVTPGEVET